MSRRHAHLPLILQWRMHRLLAPGLRASAALGILTGLLFAGGVCAPAAAVPPSVDGGELHTAVVRSDGTLWTCGNNAFGQLGLGDTAHRTSFTQVGTGTDWAAVACGGDYTVAIKQDGTLWSWGRNSFGQLGQGTADTSPHPIPMQVGARTDWVDVAAGTSHSAAVTASGELWCWGFNAQGQVGDGTTTNRSTPTRIGTNTDWVDVTCGSSHTIGTRNGFLYAWGENDRGQLGDNTTTNSSTPLLVDTAADWLMPGAGLSFTLALKTTGAAWSWGWNVYGQLGLGDAVERHRPTLVGGSSRWTQARCGYYHVLARRSDGTLWAWGNNAAGQLGLGDNVNRSLPTQVGSTADWLLIAAGARSSYGARSDGVLLTWGYNASGQLGLGDTAIRTNPTATGLKLDVTGPLTRPSRNVTVYRGGKARLQYSITDEFCASCTSVRIRIKKGTSTVKTFNLGSRNTGTLYTKSFTCTLAPGTYRWYVYATDTAGNTQQTPLRYKKLTVR